MESSRDQKHEDYAKLRDENKKLKEELKKKGEKIQNLADKGVVKRWKIGKYLHDNLAQQLTSAKMSINILKGELSEEYLTTICEEIIDIIDGSIKEVRDS